MQNKKPILIGIGILVLAVVVIAILLLTGKPFQNEYIYYDSVTLETCKSKEATLESQGWICHDPSYSTGCTDADKDGKYSLYCDPPACRKDCTLGSYDCNGFYQFKCVSSGTCDQLWQQVGIVKGKCGVECKTTSDCGNGQTCESYKCIGDVIPTDPCEGIDCPSTVCAGNIYKYSGYCADGNCIYSEQQCGEQEICSASGCVFSPQCNTNTDCPTGNECKSNKCEPISGYCEVQEACAEGQYCDTEAKLCKEKINIIPAVAITSTILIGAVALLFIKKKK